MSMITRGKSRHCLCFLVVWFALAASGQTAPKVTSPKEAFGFNIGDDYQIANYVQLESYWKTLAAQSGRMRLVDIGATAEGRRQYMAVVSSPENLRNLERYKSISRRLALAEGLTDVMARAGPPNANPGGGTL